MGSLPRTREWPFRSVRRRPIGRLCSRFGRETADGIETLSRIGR
ncbi:hypothetical protein [Haladaptatus sp. DYF46]|nr:hypothetical protein [Haladaptatus sp. DYF46]